MQRHQQQIVTASVFDPRPGRLQGKHRQSPASGETVPVQVQNV
jgi:hypothetical protein